MRVFTEEELDAAAAGMVMAALHDCPDRIYDFLLPSQVDGIRDYLRLATKVALRAELKDFLAQ